MIGVVVNSSEHVVVCEFFELFKTPWEFYRSDGQYDVLLCSEDGPIQENPAPLVLIYGDRKLPYDVENGIDIASQQNTRMLSYRGTEIPIYGGSVVFHTPGSAVLVDRDSHQPAIHLEQSTGRTVARIGYDLFREVRTLLTVGQPAINAGIPALELHIAILRDLIVASGVPLVEVPPVPHGYKFIACLTHDVDHPSIRKHKFDHTMLGFLYRAIIGSVVSLFRGRLSLRGLRSNWVAALKLPFVHLGLARDFWFDFERYPTLERGIRSSFFIIPFKNRAGRNERGPAPCRRASRYSASEIAAQIQTLMCAGCEIGLHGIDAWVDASKGREELEEIRRITGSKAIGVRMHWLYFGEQSAGTLEKAGADYDSSVGYRETVGYRAGTTQAYKPLEASQLLELPLHVMDTALFYPCYLNLSPAEASERVARIIDNAIRFGGGVIVNWHDRSIAPERLWGNSYLRLINELKHRGAWFATAAETVAWFRKRRSATFNASSCGSGSLHIDPALAGLTLPALRLRVHAPAEAKGQLTELPIFADTTLPAAYASGRATGGETCDHRLVDRAA